MQYKVRSPGSRAKVRGDLGIIITIYVLLSKNLEPLSKWRI